MLVAKMVDTLESSLEELGQRVNSHGPRIDVSQEEIDNLKSEIVVIMPAGGKGTRIRAETQSENINKVMIPIDGNESMIERAIRIYRESGIDKFVVLTGFLADVVEDFLGDGSKWGVSIKYSEDPEGRKVGNAGAIRHAIDNGTIDDSLVSIVHNPDDVIVRTKRPFPEILVEGHIRARKAGCIAAMVVVPSTPYAYSGMLVRDGKISSITKYPLIPLPTHTGLSTFDPPMYDYFRRMVDLTVESSFESVICPTLAEKGILCSTELPSECWVPVNDLKGLEAVRKALNSE